MKKLILLPFLLGSIVYCQNPDQTFDKVVLFNKSIIVDTVFFRDGTFLTSNLKADHYVATNGSDINSGTITSPWGTWDYAFENTLPGERTYIRGGIYYQPVPSADNGVKVENKSGSEGNKIEIFAYPGETPILDCSNSTYSGNNNTYGIMLYNSDYWHIKGLMVRNVEQSKESTPDVSYGILFHTSNYITLEQINSYGHEGSGIIANNVNNCLIKNCDSHDNGDLVSKNNGNGIAYVYCLKGTMNTMTGCRAWNLNYGDGIAAFRVQGSLLIDSCWAWNITGGAGDGRAFELGPTTAEAGSLYTIRNCIAATSVLGFDGTSDEVTAILQRHFNNLSYNNTTSYSYAGGVPNIAHIFRNNLNNSSGSFGSNNIRDHNSWQGYTVTSADFVSVDLTQLNKPRINGNLPIITTFTLVPGSDLRNAGIDVGTNFKGSAPDLGCFEFVE